MGVYQVNNEYMSIINARKIKKWMEERNTDKPPAHSAKDPEEKKLANALDSIRRNLKKFYFSLPDEKKAKYEERHPELEELLGIIQWIDERKPRSLFKKSKLDSTKEIYEWFEKYSFTRYPVSCSLDKTEVTIANNLKLFRRSILNKYSSLKTDEERADFIKKYPDTLEIIRILNEAQKKYEENRATEQIYISTREMPLNKAREIKKWMEDRKTNNPPSFASDDIEEKKLGQILAYSIRYKLIKPYLQLKTDEQRAEYRRLNPDIDELLEIVNWIDAQRSTRLIKRPSIEYLGKIKLWMKENNANIPPSTHSKDSNEKELGRALARIRRSIKYYNNLPTEEQKEIYRKRHPYYKEMEESVKYIYDNNPRATLVIRGVADISRVRDWMKANNTTSFPKYDSKDKEEKEMAKILRYTKSKYVFRYSKLKTEEERINYINKTKNFESSIDVLADMYENHKTLSFDKVKKLLELIKEDIEKRRKLEAAKALERDYEKALLEKNKKEEVDIENE